MRFDPATPVAVFLGPSLALAEARALLDANYYPPVRMGDVYRLLATGVRRIAVIDGVFHHSTPVWQRELLAALDEGIEVVGGASMGALRAAELASFGMHGVGTVYGWYRDGVIDGDDEVALLHTDAELGYRALSEPLVNLRYNLQRACTEGIVDADTRDALLGRLQARCFSERSWQAVFDEAIEIGLSTARLAALRQYLDMRLIDVKRADALAVLEHCATPVTPPPVTFRERWSYPGDAVRPLLQSACADDGELVTGEALLLASLGDPAAIEIRERELRRRFFLLASFDELAGAQARADTVRIASALAAACVTEPSGTALRKCGLTRAEFARECDERARVEWLSRMSPQVPSESLRAVGSPASSAAARGGREDAWIAAWARRVGIVVPEHLSPRDVDTAPGECRPPEVAAAARAVSDWLVDCGPHFFGHTDWNAQAAILRSLRFDRLRARRAEPVDVLQG